MALFKTSLRFVERPDFTSSSTSLSSSGFKVTFIGTLVLCSCKQVYAIACNLSRSLLQPDPLHTAVARHVRENDVIARLDAVQHLDLVDRAHAKTNPHAGGVDPVGFESKER